MADLDITVNLQDVEKLKEILGNLAPLYGKTVARIDRENKQLERSTKASMQVMITALNEVVGVKAQNDLAKWGAAQRQRISLMEKSEKLAERQAVAEAKVTAELIRQRGAADNLERANAQRFQSQIGGNLGLGAQGISAGASAEVFANQMENLKLKYNSVYAAQKLYERSLAELKQVELQEILTVEQHREALNKLEAEYLAFKNGTASANNMFVRGSQQAAMGLNNMGVAIQQTGYQVGDFLVQVQSGTNWMVAFGQQATQLVGVLPSMSVALGASVSTLTLWATGLGIAIPLVTALGAMWMRSSEDIDKDKKIEDKLDSIRQKTADLQHDWDLLQFGSDIGIELEKLSTPMEDLNRKIESMRTLLEDFPERLGRGANALEAQKTLLEDQLAVLIRRKLELITQDSIQKSLNYKLNQQSEYEKTVEIATRRRANETRNAYREEQKQEELMRIIASIDLTGPWNAVVSAIGRAITKADEYRASQYGAIGARGDPRDFGALPGTTNTFDTENFTLPSDSTSSGSGGGGGGSNRLDSLIQELQTEQETLDAWYQESQATLQSASDQELAILGGKNEAKLRLEQEYQDKLKSILDQEKNYRLTEMGSMFGALADLAGVGGKKMLKVQATLSAAATTIAAYETAVKAAAEAKTIPGRIAAYAKFLAVGLGAVKAIQSAGGIGGGGGGGSPGTSSVSNQTESASPQTVYIDSIDPGGLYSGQMLINLFDAFYNENDKRGKVFVVGR